MKKSFVKKYWNAAAGTYSYNRWKKSKITVFDYRWTKKSLLKELDPQKSDVVLEVGCGPGTWTKIIEKMVKSLTALDISDEMVKLAKKATKRTKLHVCEATEFKTDKKFDKIFSVRVIEYSYKKEKFLSNIFSMLKPGGKIMIITKSRPCLWDITSKSEWQRKINAVKMKKIMKDVGFNEIR